jgi:hypothetical protein
MAILRQDKLMEKQVGSVKYAKEFDIQRQMVAHMTSLSWQNISLILSLLAGYYRVLCRIQVTG